MGNKLITFER